MKFDEIPKEIKTDVELAKEIILTAGAKEVYLFGSFAEGSYTSESDIDIAIVGLEKSKFFQVYGEIISKVSRDIDLIGLDYKNEFSEQLKKTGTLIRVA
jgi:predicted nucleotidyltransferase